MATTDLNGAQTRTSTAPLPQPAVDAPSRLDRAFLPLPVIRAVIRFEKASARRDALAARGASTLSSVEFDSFKAAHDTIVESVAVLGAAGRLDLIAPAVSAIRYRKASAHCAYLAARDDFDGWWAAQDEMRACRCQLEQAGRLDLIEVAR